MTAFGTSSGYWAEFPATFRAEQVATLMRWLAIGESGAVIGGNGSGKSNLVGFLAHRPDVIQSYLADSADRYCFLKLDVNSLPALTAPYFYRGLVQALQEAAEQLDESLQAAMQQLSQRPINWDDSFAVLTLLQKAHRLVIDRAGKRVVWLLDRFEAVGQRLDTQTLSSLRSLRDQFKSQLCYVIFTRQPLSRLRDVREIDEFHEIVAANTCWLGPLIERDARWTAHWLAKRLQTTFGEAEVNQLIAVTGGLPAFMKAACLALADRSLVKGQSSQSWTEQLLTRPEVQRNCQEIWADLSMAEQAGLFALIRGMSAVALDQRVVTTLKQGGLLVTDTDPTARQTGERPAPQVKIFSPILMAFVGQQQRGAAGGIIELHPRTRAVLRGGVPLGIELTPHEDRLLSFFLEHHGEICQKDMLTRAIWPEEQVLAGVRDDRLAQLVRRLREKIEPDASQPVYIQAVRGQGYRFVQPEA